MSSYAPAPALPRTSTLVAALVALLLGDDTFTDLLGGAYVYAHRAPAEPAGTGHWMRAVVRQPYIPMGLEIVGRSHRQPFEVMIEAPAIDDPGYGVDLAVEAAHERAFLVLVGEQPVVGGAPLPLPIRWPGRRPTAVAWDESAQLYYSTARYEATLAP